MEWLLLAGVIVVLSFGFVLLFGAPYLPTLSPQIKTALELAALQPGQTLLELGSGDGKVLIAAAKVGLNAVGYEINPFLALFSWLRTRRYRKQVRVVWGSFWAKDWPPAEGIFTFLHPRFMLKLDKKIVQYDSKPVKLVSFAFSIPNRKVDVEKNGVYLYKYS